MTTIVHLMQRVEWERLVPEEPITNPSLTTEGFIHCTDDADVLLGVANAFYRGVAGDFVALDVNVADLTSACIWEAPAHITPVGGDGAAVDGAGPVPLAPLFPHVYGPIDRVAVTAVRAVIRDAHGAFVGYETSASA